MDPKLGGLWIGSSAGGITRIADGQVQSSYGASDGLAGGWIHDIRVRPDGTVWVASDRGLSRLRDGRFVTLNRKLGLPCDEVDSTLDDDDGSLWLYMPCGLARISAPDLRTLDDKTESTKSWRFKITVLDNSDGIRGFGGSLGSFSPHMSKSGDGKLWLLGLEGATEIDPRHLPLNKLPPPVHLDGIIADRAPYAVSAPLHLPPLVRNLEMDYTALSLVAPEKVLFRYKLEGHDHDWQNVGNRRAAFYTDLPPGNYRFRVIASNNSGVWNDEGATLDFSIAPAYWQTTWFRALCVAAILAFLWMLYWRRMRQLAHVFETRVEAQVEERTRLARELHDTLLQSFNGLLLRFRTVQALFSKNPDEARKILDSAIDQTRQALTEGRQAVQGLRSSAIGGQELADAIKTLTEELAADPTHPTPAEVRLNIEGTPRPLRPLIRDEIYRIASEALRNALRHAGASRIEIQLGYDEGSFELRVRDDGKGIDPKFLADESLPGHFGLQGMRERAERMGAALKVWSAPASGTELALSVPAATAYGTEQSAASSRLRWKIYRGGGLKP
jgi:signal transduction histidine kinase